MIDIQISFESKWCEEKRKDSGNISRKLFKEISAVFDSAKLIKNSTSELFFSISGISKEEASTEISKIFEKLFGESIESSKTFISLNYIEDNNDSEAGANSGASSEISSEASSEISSGASSEISSEVSSEASTKASSKASSEAGSDFSEEKKVEVNSDEIAIDEKLSEENMDEDKEFSKKLEILYKQIPIKYSSELRKYVKELVYIIPAMKKLNVDEAIFSDNVLLAIDEGYGLEQFANAVNCILLDDIDQLNDNNKIKPLVINSLQKINGQEWEAFVKSLKSLCKDSKTKVVAMDISSCYQEFSGQETIKKVHEIQNICKEVLIIFRIPCLDSANFNKVYDIMDELMSVTPLVVSPVSMDNMVNYVEDRLGSRKFKLTEVGRERLEMYIEQIKEEDVFVGYDTLKNVADKVIREKFKIYASSEKRKSESENVMNIIDHDVFTSLIKKDIASSGEDPYKLLSDLVGIAEVKERVKDIVCQIKTAKRLEENGNKVERPCIHMQFLGAPGTGKTTVARLVGGILKKEGILSRGHFFEKKGRDFCGQYIGETTPKTTAICRDAYGSVLFIDEAYSLAASDSDRDYGKEAAAALVAEMENHKTDMCVIVAGYEDEMEKLFLLNDGLKDRLPHKIVFPNYTKEELVQIFMGMIDGKFEYEQSLKETVEEFLMNLPDDIINDKKFSNGRFIRNLYERTWGKAANRYRDKEKEKLVVKSEDLKIALKDPEFEKYVSCFRQKKNPIGF